MPASNVRIWKEEAAEEGNNQAGQEGMKAE